MDIFPANEAERTIEALQTLEAGREILQTVIKRERLWNHYAWGKTGRAFAIAGVGLFMFDEEAETESLMQSRLRQQTRLQLLVCELAIHCYRGDLLLIEPEYVAAEPAEAE